MATSDHRVERLKDQSRPQRHFARPRRKPGKSIAVPAERTAVRKSLENAVQLTRKPLDSGPLPDQRITIDEGRLNSSRVTSDPTKRWSEGCVLELGLYPSPLSHPNRETSKSNEVSPPTPSGTKAAQIGDSICAAPMIPTKLKEFGYFSSLPSELRLQIWRQFAYLPRVISLEFHSTSARRITYHPQPVALQICQESREEALKAYRLAFGRSRVFVNFDTDIFFLNNSVPTLYASWVDEPTTCLIQFLRFASFDDTQRIQNFAVGCIHKAFQVNYPGGSLALIPPDYWAGRGVYKELPKYKSLKRLIFAVEAGTPQYGRRRTSACEEALQLRKHLGRTHEISLRYPADFFEAWQQHNFLYVDSVKDYLERLRKTKYPEWEVPSVEMANIKVEAI